MEDQQIIQVQRRSLVQRKKAGKRRQEQLPLETQIKSGQWISLIFKSPLYTGRNLNIQNRGGSRTAAASKMERFVIIVNGWEPLTIITKHPILDVAAVLDRLCRRRPGGLINVLRLFNLHPLSEGLFI